MKLVHDTLGVFIYTSTQMLWFRIVGESSELFLYGFGELRIKYDRVSRSLAREFLIKVGYIKHRFLKKGGLAVITKSIGYPRNDVQLKA